MLALSICRRCKQMPVLPVQFICAKCQEDSDKILGLTFDQWPVKE